MLGSAGRFKKVCIATGRPRLRSCHFHIALLMPHCAMIRMRNALDASVWIRCATRSISVKVT